MPIRIQRKRTKGWRMPEGAVYVGRPTKWGNYRRIGIDVPSGFDAKREYRQQIDSNVWTFPTKRDIKEQLKGKDLVCWCPLDQCCHAELSAFAISSSTVVTSLVAVLDLTQTLCTLPHY